MLNPCEAKKAFLYTQPKAILKCSTAFFKLTHRAVRKWSTSQTWSDLIPIRLLAEGCCISQLHLSKMLGGTRSFMVPLLIQRQGPAEDCLAHPQMSTAGSATMHPPRAVLPWPNFYPVTVACTWHHAATLQAATGTQADCTLEGIADTQTHSALPICLSHSRHQHLRHYHLKMAFEIKVK